jgi:hypothetical protein
MYREAFHDDGILVIMIKIYCAILITFSMVMLYAPTIFAANTVPVVPPQATFEDDVRTYFADLSVMIDIARCESNFRQFTDSGTVFYGGAGQEYIGIFQFARSFHALPATALGFDLATAVGNMQYARHLYETAGTRPWQACVPDSQTTVVDLQRIALMKQLIILLQQLLALQLQQQ